MRSSPRQPRSSNAAVAAALSRSQVSGSPSSDTPAVARLRAAQELAHGRHARVGRPLRAPDPLELGSALHAPAVVEEALVDVERDPCAAQPVGVHEREARRARPRASARRPARSGGRSRGRSRTGRGPARRAPRPGTPRAASARRRVRPAGRCRTRASRCSRSRRPPTSAYANGSPMAIGISWRSSSERSLSPMIRTSGTAQQGSCQEVMRCTVAASDAIAPARPRGRAPARRGMLRRALPPHAPAR